MFIDSMIPPVLLRKFNNYYATDIPVFQTSLSQPNSYANSKELFGCVMYTMTLRQDVLLVNRP